MKTKKILFFLCFIIVLGCKRNDNQRVIDWQNISKNVKYTYSKDQILLKSGKFEYTFDKNKLPFNRVVLLNNSLLGYFLELGEVRKIIGVAGVDYIYDDSVKHLLKTSVIQSVGTDQKYDVEKILSLKPDVIFTNYIATFENTYNILRKNGVQIIFLDEYLEQKPLEKTAYLKLFGELLGVPEKGKKRYAEIEKNYDSLKSLTKNIQNKPIILVNEMYGNQWFMSGGQTYVAHYLKDAGGEYIWADNQDEKSIPLSFEEVFVKAQRAEIWVNVGNYKNKKELLAMNSSYAKMPVFTNGKVYSSNKRYHKKANDLYESGVVRADLILRDYIKIFHPHLLRKDTLIYMNELK